MIDRPVFASAVAAATLSLAMFATLPAFARSHVEPASAPSVAPTPTAVLSAPKLFVNGNAKLYNPDGIVVTQKYVFIDWQGQSDHLPGPSTIVKYDLTGKRLGAVAITGRCDGLRMNPATHMLWATFNNDGLNGNPPRQPQLYTIDPRTLTTNLYEFPKVQPHGGGYDDIAFVGGQAFLSASSPTLNSHGINNKAIVVTATLTNTGLVSIAPIINGNATVFDENTMTYGPMNFTDPDSLAVDANHDLVVVGDNDQQLLIIKNPGRIGSQAATVYNYGTQFDDVAWTSGTSGTLWIADTATNSIYTVAASYPAGTVFGETGTGNPVSSFISTIGVGQIITPLLTQQNGVFGPTSLIFVPTGGNKDSI